MRFEILKHLIDLPGPKPELDNYKLVPYQMYWKHIIKARGYFTTQHNLDNVVVNLNMNSDINVKCVHQLYKIIQLKN